MAEIDIDKTVKDIAELVEIAKKLSEKIKDDNKSFLDPIFQGIYALDTVADKKGVFDSYDIDCLLEQIAKPEWREIIRETAKDLEEAGYTQAALQLEDVAKKLKIEGLEVYSFADFKKWIENYNPADNLNILDIGGENKSGGRWKLEIPPATFNVIGARAGTGKTSALINIARANIENLKSHFKSVVFISLEESEHDIIRKLIFNIMYQKNAEADEKDRIDLSEEPYKDFFAKNGKSLNKNETVSPFCNRYYDEAEKEIKDAMEDGRFFVYGEIYRNIAQIKRILSCHEESLILLDYIQMVQPLERTGVTYKDIQEICNVIIHEVKFHENTVIAGAQLNRNGREKGDEWDRAETMNDTLLREGDDILTSANCVIFLGRHNQDTFFWKIIKNRSGRGAGISSMFNSDMRYNFLENAWNPIDKNKSEKKNDEEEKKPKSIFDMVK